MSRVASQWATHERVPRGRAHQVDVIRSVSARAAGGIESIEWGHHRGHHRGQRVQPTSVRFPVCSVQVALSWGRLGRALCSEWNIIGVDLQDNLWAADWGSGDEKTDWRMGASRVRALTRSKGATNRSRGHVDRPTLFVAPATRFFACRHSIDAFTLTGLLARAAHPSASI